MANGEKHYVGTDVGKMGLEVAVHGRQRTEAFPNTAEGIGKLVRKLENLQPALIVVEATGGYERNLVCALLAAALPIAVVHPQRVEQLMSIPGVGYITASTLCAHLPGLETCSHKVIASLALLPSPGQWEDAGEMEDLQGEKESASGALPCCSYSFKVQPDRLCLS